MKRLMFLAATVIALLLFSVISYAGDLNSDFDPPKAGNLEITGGISDKEVEATFDTYRTLTGVAERGTVITISVCLFDEDAYKEVSSDTLTVGKSGVFSSDINLEEGENYITVHAQYEGAETVIEVIINRKSLDIKQGLEEQNIIIPGLNIIRAK